MVPPLAHAKIAELLAGTGSAGCRPPGMPPVTPCAGGNVEMVASVLAQRARIKAAVAARVAREAELRAQMHGSDPDGDFALSMMTGERGARAQRDTRLARGVSEARACHRRHRLLSRRARARNLGSAFGTLPRRQQPLVLCNQWHARLRCLHVAGPGRGGGARFKLRF